MPCSSASRGKKRATEKSALAVITLARESAALATELAQALNAGLYIHEGALPLAAAGRGAKRTKPHAFSRVAALTEALFSRMRGLIYLMPTGVVARSLAPLITSKLTDPAVVVLDVRARYAISFLSGHEGGANALTLRVANLTGAEPVITTTTEAVKDVIAGIGCRKGAAAATIIEALETALAAEAVPLAAVRLLATASVKANEPGLREAAKALGVPLRIIDAESIRLCPYKLKESAFVQSKVGLPGVCEPAALLAGRRTILIRNKTAYRGVTVALARELPASCGS